ncbi:MAG: hypothetical protein LVQ96_00455 [Thermoplasmatales archaeon]|nr:hypothetical protein [Thermoplasmatales archaeon]MCW6169630.1 hypothetical protein [Thermoplasmatales archaeon]
MKPLRKFFILFLSDTVLLLLFLIYQFTSIFAVEKNYQIQNLTNHNASGSGGIHTGIKFYMSVYTHPLSVFFIVAFVSVYVATFVYAYKHIKK